MVWNIHWDLGMYTRHTHKGTIMLIYSCMLCVYYASITGICSENMSLSEHCGLHVQQSIWYSLLYASDTSLGCLLAVVIWVEPRASWMLGAPYNWAILPALHTYTMWYPPAPGLQACTACCFPEDQAYCNTLPSMCVSNTEKGRMHAVQMLGDGYFQLGYNLLRTTVMYLACHWTRCHYVAWPYEKYQGKTNVHRWM